MSAIEIENALRQLPAEQANDLLCRLKDSKAPDRPKELTDEAIEKWRVRSGFAAGMTTEEYMRIIRGGDRD
jgi:hypothetical protein